MVVAMSWVPTIAPSSTGAGRAGQEETRQLQAELARLRDLPGQP